jgi:hypothetical protein
MEIERVCTNALDDASRVVDGHAVIELDGADIGEENDVRCHVAHAIGRQQGDVFERGALTSERKRDTRGLGGDGEIIVDRTRALRATGHRRNNERCCEAVAEKVDGGLDVFERAFREGFVT